MRPGRICVEAMSRIRSRSTDHHVHRCGKRRDPHLQLRLQYRYVLRHHHCCCRRRRRLQCLHLAPHDAQRGAQPLVLELSVLQCGEQLLLLLLVLGVAPSNIQVCWAAGSGAGEKIQMGSGRMGTACCKDYEMQPSKLLSGKGQIAQPDQHVWVRRASAQNIFVIGARASPPK